MPPKKGRKRRPRDRHHTEADEPRDSGALEQPARQRDETARPPTSALPKLRARIAGFVVGVLTLFIGVLNIAQGFNSGSLTYTITGVVMVVLAIFLGVLTLVPGRLRDLLIKR